MEWRRVHGESLLQELHWVPINSPIKFKLLTMAFKCIQGSAPVYMYMYMYVLGRNQDIPYVPKKITIGLSAWITFKVVSESKYNFM